MKHIYQAKKFLFITSCSIFGVVTSMSQAAPTGQLGILTPGTLSGINPATGASWKSGDTYRFAFFTSTTTTAEATDIAVYNSFVQNLADLTTVYDIGSSDGVTWRVIGSTDDMDARDNTSTNQTEDGTGEAIFLLDGSTVVANDYADLWDGEIQNIINLTEQGVVTTHWPFTGTYWDGTKATGNPTSHSALGGGAQIHQGKSDSTTEWVWRQWTGDPPTTELNLYALSDPLVIGGPAIRLEITPDGVGGYDFEWDSKSGKVYDLVSATDLSSSPTDWAVYDGKTGIEGAPPENFLTNIPASGSERYFAVIENDPPPLLSEDFEGGGGSFSLKVAGGGFTPVGSVWEPGPPDSTGPGGTVNSGSGSSSSCWGTNLGPGFGGDYLVSTETCLRSRVIDLTAVAGAELTFAEALDIASGDTAVVNIIAEASDTVIAAAIYTADDTGDPADANWAGVSAIDLAAGLGQKVRIEWCFSGVSPDYLGWYIDDVEVIETTP